MKKFILLLSVLLASACFAQQPVQGTKTNNNAAPGATNIGALTCIANAVAPTNTEGNQTLCSEDLTSNQRVTGEATADTTNSARDCVILSTASTNATNCKNAAGNEYGFDLYNTTTTVYYLRIYNLSTAPTCSSATGFIRSIPVVPASASGGVGSTISNFTVPLGFSTGISFCITGGSSSTDNTNAAVGIFGTIRYK
jgi:hypothetical protein